MVQIELGTELEEHIAHLAKTSGLSVSEFVRHSLEQSAATDDAWTTDKQSKHEAAIDGLLHFGDTYKFRLGPDRTIKDLINEGRR